MGGRGEVAGGGRGLAGSTGRGGTRQPGRAESASDGRAARLRHRHHTARGPEGRSGWRERGERPEEALCALPSSWGRVRPNADPRKQGSQREGLGKLRGRGDGRQRRLPEQERQKSMQEGAEGEQGQESAPQEQLGRRRAGGGLRLPHTPWGPRRAGRAPFFSMQRAWRSVQPGAWCPAAPSRAPALLAFPGGGVSYKDSCGSLERGARGRFSSESSPRARPASGPDRGMSRGAVCHHLVF